MLMQEMESCDIGEDPDVDGVHSDSDKTVETEVNVFVVNMNVQSAAYSCNLCWIVHAAMCSHIQEAVSIAAALNHSVPGLYCLR